jgi:hypothetical protein
MRRWIWVTTLFTLAALSARADKGHISPRPVALSESSQRAIILHNRSEELLILGIELRAQEKVEILEFIPFPSEPQVTLASGNPFEEVQKLIKEKKLEIQDSRHVKKGGASTTPVEIRFSAKVGLHDVTVIKINDTKGLSDWIGQFFQGKGIKERPDLTKVVPVAEDYIQRGITYFVFDYIPVGVETRLIEPLAYRFKTDRIYYPLKTSNIVGGQGLVDLIMVLPGSFTSEWRANGKSLWDALRKVSAAKPLPWNMSSSSKVYLNEMKALHPDAESFFKKTKKLYMQVLRFVGDYQFNDDLFLDLGDTDPFPTKFHSFKYYMDIRSRQGDPPDYLEGFSEDERNDYFEAHPNSPLNPKNY